MDIIDYLFENSKPPQDESEIKFDETVFADFEAINSLCCFEKWKGQPRNRSAVSIMTSVDGWRATLVDHDNDRSTSSTGKDVQAALESLNSLLMSGTVNWYYWKHGKGKKPKKPGST